MCIIFTNPASEPLLSDDWIKNFYSRNKDGYGVMYHIDGVLYTAKGVGTEDDAVAFYKEHAGKGVDTIFHFRLKTHGAIETDQSHPYDVFENETYAVAMMHNGILSTGNAGDEDKSDTWHFIKDYLTPIANAHPDVLFNEAFIKLLGGFIGNNRFVFMSNTGQIGYVNKAQGVMWGERWFSNTYAWDAAKAGVVKPIPTYQNYGTVSRRSYYYDDFDDASYIGKAYVPPVKPKELDTSKPLFELFGNTLDSTKYWNVYIANTVYKNWELLEAYIDDYRLAALEGITDSMGLVLDSEGIKEITKAASIYQTANLYKYRREANNALHGKSPWIVVNLTNVYTRGLLAAMVEARSTINNREEKIA